MYTKKDLSFILSSNIISEITQAYPRIIQLLRQSLFYPKGPQKEQLQRCRKLTNQTSAKVEKSFKRRLKNKVVIRIEELQKKGVNRDDLIIFCLVN